MYREEIRSYSKAVKEYNRAYIEITNVCNLNCSFCPISERDKQFMELSKIEQAISQVSPLAKQICLHLMGEPLAHPQFQDILKIAQTYNAQIQLTTNGLLLKKYRDVILSTNCIRQVNISAQSYMDNFPGKPIDQYLEDISSFILTSLVKKPDLYLNLRLWNIEDIDQTHNEPIFSFFEEKLNIKINRKVELGRIKSKRLVGRFYFHFDSRFEWPRIDRPIQSTTGRCNGLIDHFAIHADGTVSPCCLDDQKIINLGNIFDTNISAILETERAIKIKDGFKNNKLVEDLCQRCTYINRFKK